MPKGHPRRSIISALTGLACATACPFVNAAHAQFFPGFGAPQQIQTARGAIQLAPGWHVANSPVRTSGGYRVAVRSETGEQRNMLIGVNGALAITRPDEPRAARAPARPLPQLARPTRHIEPKKPRVAMAAIHPAPRMPAPVTIKRSRTLQPASLSSEAAKPEARAPLSKDTPPKWQTPTPLDPQAPGYAHGVPINPLD